MELKSGDKLGPYEILAPLGKGGMGEVYQAHDPRLRRDVAIKVSAEQFSERFEREARAIAALNHPNICQIYDVGPNYLVMEYVEGKPLPASLPVDTATEFARQIADGVAAAHARGIVHRDLKPGNILVAADGRVKILDFGLAMRQTVLMPTDSTLTLGLTVPGTVLGTIAYMSPEQARGQTVDERSDLWSIGVILYEMVTGSRPFHGPTAPIIFEAILNKPPPPVRERNPNVPEGVERVIGRLLEKDRDLRYPTAVELRGDLERLQTGTIPAVQGGRGMPLPGYRFAAAATLILGVGGFLLWQQLGHAKPLTDKDTIVLADFKNTTNDSVFDGTLRQGLSIQLEQSPFLSLLSDQAIRKALVLMSQKPDTPLTPELGRDVCERTGSAAVLEGSISPLGSQYVLGLRAKDCRTGEVLDEEQVQAAKKEDVLSALSEIASKFRTRVGESLSTVSLHNTPLAEATTSKLEALKAYSTGWKVVASSGSAASVPLFKRATEIDPEFAMAYATVGRMYGDIGEAALSAENSSKAYQLRERASDRERFFITANYDLNVTGNLEMAQQTCELWKRTYPRDGRPHTHLAGMVYPAFGKYEESVYEATAAIGIEPDFWVGYNILAGNYIHLDRLSDAATALQRASARKLDPLHFRLRRFKIAFLNGDTAGMERELAISREGPGVEDELSGQEALALVYSGHLKQAVTMSRRGADLAQRAGRPEAAAVMDTGPALWQAFFGDAAEAKQSAVAVIALSKDRDVEYGAAFALALSGESVRSQTLADDLGKRFGEDTSVRTSYMPVLRALLAMNHGEPAKAIDLLQTATPYDLANPRNFGALYPVYVRGEAYLAANQGIEAAAEFQKILDHRGLVVSDPIGALAHLQLARALALSGDKIKAKTAFQDFLTLWKEADQGIPVLKQAKQDYAALN